MTASLPFTPSPDAWPCTEHIEAALAARTSGEFVPCYRPQAARHVVVLPTAGATIPEGTEVTIYLDAQATIPANTTAGMGYPFSPGYVWADAHMTVLLDPPVVTADAMGTVKFWGDTGTVYYLRYDLPYGAEHVHEVFLR